MNQPKPKQPKNVGDVLRCNFCNKRQRDVRKLIAGPTVYICDECVKICVDIIAEDGISLQKITDIPAAADIIRAADAITPGHDEAKRILAAALVQHAHHILEEPARPGLSPILLTGAMGAGKSQIVRAMAQAARFAVATIEVPLLFADSPFKPQFDFPGFDEKAGVILLNKLETVAARGSKVEECRRVQQALISIIDGASVQATTSIDKRGGVTSFDTTRTLFIALGTFPELASGDIDQDALIRQGYLPELIARFGTFITLRPLTSGDMTELLTRKDGLVSDCKARFAKYGVRVHIEPDAVAEIVRLGVGRKAGVRGLKALVDRLGIALAGEKITSGDEVKVDAAYVARNLR